jgi:predicted CoA-binding protein
MKEIIRAFTQSKKIAVVGASDNRDNFGKYLMEELTKLEYEVLPVNPRYETVSGQSCFPSVRELPPEVESVILAVPSDLSVEIIDQCIGTGVKRVWMIQGMGRGAYHEEAHRKCIENRIDLVYGFCPMMLFGGGFHRFHFWLRKSFGKLPPEYLVTRD